MKLRAFQGIGLPRLIANREDGVGTIFDLELPADSHLGLIEACSRYVYYHGDVKQQQAFQDLVEEWSDAILATSHMKTIIANVHNESMSDHDFRELIRSIISL